MRMGEGGDGFDVDDAEERIAWRLDPDQSRRRPKGAFDAAEVRHVGEGDVELPRAEDVAHELRRPEVRVVGSDDVSAGLERLQHCCRRGGPGGEARGGNTALELRE